MSQPAKAPASAQPLLVRRAAVLGAGTMGSRIAALLANAGIPVLLFDVASAEGPRSRVAKAAIDALAKAKPAPLYEAQLASLITPANFDDDLPKLARCEWVIEAVVEDMAVKTDLLHRVEPHLAPDALLTTNTSGLSIQLLASTLFAARKRFFGTHFFNPPRYLQLLEIIPTPDTDQALVTAFTAFADRVLGKQVVRSRDVPNFIANRIGLAVLSDAARLAFAQGLTVEETDALTGPALGWPRTGTFRLADLIGIDIVAKVLARQNVDPKLNALFAKMIERGWLGDKAGQGFYKKGRGDDGQEQLLALDLATCEYRPTVLPTIPALDAIKAAPSAAERIKRLLSADPTQDRAAAFCWPLLANLWNFAATQIGLSAATAPAIDLALRSGFGWERGPFELFDAAGVAWTVERLSAFGQPIHPRVAELLGAGFTSWYSPNGTACYQPGTAKLEPLPVVKGQATVAAFRRAHGTLAANANASLVDLGDGIACIELHAPHNALSLEAVDLILAALDSSTTSGYAGFVLSGDREAFSTGINLAHLLEAIQAGQWEAISAAIRRFQQMNTAIKFCPRPVVAAPFGHTLGGGAEIVLHAAARQAHAETHLGLVECGVGLLPAGGGIKELLLRAIDQAAAQTSVNLPARFAHSAELLSAIRPAFDLIVQAKTSGSAAEARTLGLLAPSDPVTRNRARLLLDARHAALAMARSGYSAPQPRKVPAPGASVLAALQTATILMGEAGHASEHDQKIARKVASVLTGGGVTAGTPVSEEYLLSLELEAFLSLCGEPRTQERIAFTLKTGKALRN